MFHLGAQGSTDHSIKYGEEMTGERPMSSLRGALLKQFCTCLRIVDLVFVEGLVKGVRQTIFNAGEYSKRARYGIDHLKSSEFIGHP